MGGAMNARYVNRNVWIAAGERFPVPEVRDSIHFTGVMDKMLPSLSYVTISSSSTSPKSNVYSMPLLEGLGASIHGKMLSVSFSNISPTWLLLFGSPLTIVSPSPHGFCSP